MYYAEYESEEGVGFALRSTLERRQQTEADSRHRVCELLELDEDDPRATCTMGSRGGVQPRKGEQF